MSALLPIVTWSGRVHYRSEHEPPQYDAWDRQRAIPAVAAACNPNTFGCPPATSPQGNLIASRGTAKGELLDDLPVCKRCAKRAAA